jgi:hypothetical protein
MPNKNHDTLRRGFIEGALPKLGLGADQEEFDRDSDCDPACDTVLESQLGPFQP